LSFSPLAAALGYYYHEEEDFGRHLPGATKNDPCITKLNLADMVTCSTVGVPGRSPQLGSASAGGSLKPSRRTVEIDVVRDLSVDSILQLSHFMRSSPSLKHLEMMQKNIEHALRPSRHIYLEAISRSTC
jgi:hypothetical protein